MSRDAYDLFFPDPRAPGYARVVESALSICADCPIVARCGAYADTIPDVYGIWGGRVRTPSQRRRYGLLNAARQLRKFHELTGSE